MTQVLRKDIDTERLLTLLPHASDIQFWRSLNPSLSIIDNTVIPIPSGLDSDTRLRTICRDLRRYSYVTFRDSPQSKPLLAFLDAHALYK